MQMSLIALFIISFLSTPSGWRATALESALLATVAISIHALRVEGDERDELLVHDILISIHALRVEGDPLTGQPYFG